MGYVLIVKLSYEPYEYFDEEYSGIYHIAKETAEREMYQAKLDNIDNETILGFYIKEVNMPKSRANSENKEVKKTIDHEIKVLRAKEWQDIFFIDLEVNGVSIYGCRFLKNKNDKWFVAFPAKKEGDKYYHHCFVDFSEKDIDTIDKLIDEKLDEENK